VDFYAVKKLLGHKSIKMTERYAHHYPESLRASIEVLDRAYGPKNYDSFMTIEARGESSACQAAENSCKINQLGIGSGSGSGVPSGLQILLTQISRRGFWPGFKPNLLILKAE
jgi:hypothetical protein